MPESRSHKAGKKHAARKEVLIRGGRRLDAKRGRTVIEIERSGAKQGIDRAIRRLKTQRNAPKILRVPQNDMDKAIQEARRLKANVTVTNLSKTRRRKA